VLIPYDDSGLSRMGGQVQAGGIIYGVSDGSYVFPTQLLVGVCSSTQACNPGSSLWRMDIETDSVYGFYEGYFAPSILHFPKLKRAALPFHWYETQFVLWSGDRFVRMFCLDAYGRNFDEGCTMIEGPSLFGILGIEYDDIVINGRTIEDQIDCWRPLRKYKFICKRVAKSAQSFITFNSAGCKTRRPLYSWISAVVGTLLLLFAGIIYYARKPRN